MKLPMPFIYIISLYFMSLLSSCSDDNKPTKQEEDTDYELGNVYYADQNNAIYNRYMPLPSGSTIYSSVDGTLYIKVDSVSNQMELQFDRDAVEITEQELNDGTTISKKYSIYFKQALSTTIHIIDQSTNKFRSIKVDVDVKTLTYTQINLNNSPIENSEIVYTVDIVDNSLKEGILQELSDTYSPQKGRLNYTSLNSGKFESTIGEQNNIITGTFTVEDTEDGLLFNFCCDKQEYQVFAKQSSIVNGYYITQDLTEEFRKKYPSVTINRIEISSFVLTSST